MSCQRRWELPVEPEWPDSGVFTVDCSEGPRS